MRPPSRATAWGSKGFSRPGRVSGHGPLGRRRRSRDSLRVTVAARSCGVVFRRPAFSPPRRQTLAWPVAGLQYILLYSSPPCSPCAAAGTPLRAAGPQHCSTRRRSNNVHAALSGP